MGARYYWVELLLLWSSWQVARAADVTLTVSNEGDRQRQEVVAVELQAVCQRLGVAVGESFVVRNAFGQEVGYQKTYDNKLLLDVAVQPHGQAVYRVTKGVPQPPKSYVQGAMYSIRKDDIAWENDRGAYRVYGPALQRTGEKSFGTDVWVKNTPELVVAHRYRMDYEGNVQEDSLYKIGKKSEARQIDLRTSFHLDQGNGMDAYSVGPTLGCGAPALMVDGRLVFPYCYERYQILDNGPLRFTVALDYAPNVDGIKEHRIITLDKGMHLNRMTVWYDGIQQPVALASGVVLHSDAGVVVEKDRVLYADPTDNPQKHNSQIFVAALFPNGLSQTLVHQQDGHRHALGILNDYRGQRYTYYFGSAWSRYDVPTLAQWQSCVDNELHQLRNPLSIQIQ